MRTFGLVLLALGVAAFFYCQQQMAAHPPAPQGLSMGEAWRYPYSRWQAGQYASGFAACVGGLFLLFPKGR
jgi:hypothetical protein